MQSHTRFALAPVAFGLAALLAQAPAGAQGYNPNMPPGYVEQGQAGPGCPSARKLRSRRTLPRASPR
jgi:hypothetical protein